MTARDAIIAEFGNGATAEKSSKVGDVATVAKNAQVGGAWVWDGCMDYIECKKSISASDILAEFGEISYQTIMTKIVQMAETIEKQRKTILVQEQEIDDLRRLLK